MTRIEIAIIAASIDKNGLARDNSIFVEILKSSSLGRWRRNMVVRLIAIACYAVLVIFNVSIARGAEERQAKIKVQMGSRWPGPC